MYLIESIECEDRYLSRYVIPPSYMPFYAELRAGFENAGATIIGTKHYPQSGGVTIDICLMKSKLAKPHLTLVRS